MIPLMGSIYQETEIAKLMEAGWALFFFAKRLGFYWFSLWSLWMSFKGSRCIQWFTSGPKHEWLTPIFKRASQLLKNS
jgi:hypothetical protein